MEHAFVFPSLNEKEIAFWQAALDKLERKKGSWEQFLHNIPLSQHPALRLATSKEHNNLLHLAVLANETELVHKLATDVSLKLSRNAFGLTPLELAQFLDRSEMQQALSPRAVPSESLLHPVFESKKVFEEVLLRAKKAKTEDVIPSERIWMGIYFDSEIQRGHHPSISIRHVDPEVGSGVFAEQRIPPCGFVGEYTGMIKEKKNLRGEFYSVRYSIWGMDKKRFVIDGEARGNFTRYINHSNKPNLSLQSIYWRGIPRMIFVALKEIQEGTQLTFDYGHQFWKECKKTPQLL